MRTNFFNTIFNDLSETKPENSVMVKPKMVPLSVSQRLNTKDFTNYFFEFTEAPMNSVPISPKQNPEPATNKPIYVPDPAKESPKPYDLFRFLEDCFLFGVRKSAKRGET